VHANSVELYDTRRDPGEVSDRAAQRPPELQPMVDQIDRYLKNSKPPWGVESPTIEVDGLRLNQLRALGYRLGS